jgi:predicted transcriptional regulator
MAYTFSMKPVIVDCPYCGGTGKVETDTSIGMRWRQRRVEAGVSLRQAAYVMQISPAYLSDLELGRRGWNTGIERRYEQALKQI